MCLIGVQLMDSLLKTIADFLLNVALKITRFTNQLVLLNSLTFESLQCLLQ